jgi:hypothetical protein
METKEVGMAFLPSFAPTDVKDFIVRVVKAFFAAALSGATVAAFTNVNGLEAMAFAGLTAAYSVIANAILKWANTPTGATT